MVEEQRRSPRIELAVELRGKDAEGRGDLYLQAGDLSTGGSFLRSELLLEEGERIQLEFRLPGAPNLLKAAAEVLWVRRFPSDGQPAGMGVVFREMTDPDRDVLERYLRSLQTVP